MRTYSLYGLQMKSQCVLPGPEVRERGVADIEFLPGSAPLFSRASKEAATQPSAGKWFRYARLNDGADYIQWPGLFEFVISVSGREIAGRFFSEASLEAFQTYFLGQVISFSLLKLGIEPLHATVVVIDGEAVALVGDTGYGKSSLAAAFLQAGHGLLTDDLLTVKKNGNSLVAYPGPQRIKLFPETAKLFLGEQVVGTSMNPHTKKLIIALNPSQSSHTPRPLRAIYVLRHPKEQARSKRVRISERRQRLAFLDVVSNTFNTVIKSPERLTQQFNLAAHLAFEIPIRSLSYPRDLSRLPEVVERIRTDLSQGRKCA